MVVDQEQAAAVCTVSRKRNKQSLYVLQHTLRNAEELCTGMSRLPNHTDKGQERAKDWFCEQKRRRSQLR